MSQSAYLLEKAAEKKRVGFSLHHLWLGRLQVAA